MSAAIEIVDAREIIDSRGNPTVEVDIVLADGSVGRAAVPSGASTGLHEAVELRDGDKKRFGGRGTRKAVANVTDTIAPALYGLDATDQAGIDALLCELDGTPNKANLGANAILGVSLAWPMRHRRRTTCAYRYLGGVGRGPCQCRLQHPQCGKHASDSTDFQAFMVAPSGRRPMRGLRAGAEVFAALSRSPRRGPLGGPG